MERTRSPSPSPRRPTSWSDEAQQYPYTLSHLDAIRAAGQDTPDLSSGPIRSPVTEEEKCEYEIIRAKQSLRKAELHLMEVERCKGVVNQKKVKQQLSEIRDVISDVGDMGKKLSGTTLSYVGEKGAQFAQNVGRTVGKIGNRYVFEPASNKFKELSEYGIYDTPEKRISLSNRGR